MIDPVAFELLGRPVYWYGICVALGFLAAVLHWNRLARREHFPEGIGSDLGLIVIIGGVVGARLAYVLANLAHYQENPWEIIRIDQGGLIFYGGFIMATLTVAAFGWRRKLPLLHLGDFTVSALPLGHAFGRLGCFLNGCCYGAPSDVPWACYAAEAHRHPVQLYEVAFNLALYGVLYRLLPRKKPGTVGAIYLLAYGAWRFLIEFLRGDQRLRVAALDGAQIVSLALILFGAALLVFLRRTPAKE